MTERATTTLLLISALACATGTRNAAVQPARGTAADLATQYNNRPLPAADGEDPIALPRWLRAYVRERLSGLPTKGRPQYPRDALALAEDIRTNPSMATVEVDRRISALQPAVEQVVDENRRRAQYPADWEVQVPEGTKLAALRDKLNADFSVLPERDLDDRTPIPIWFRVYLRKKYPDLPREGPYQYPRHATRELALLLNSPNSIGPG